MKYRPFPRASGFRLLAPLTVLLLLASPDIYGACSLAVTGVAFGNYDVFDGTDTLGTGNTQVDCDTSTTYTLTLSPGNGTYTQRQMVNGSHILAYNLYTDASRTVVWGDGSGATATVSGESSGGTTEHTIYGHIPAKQNAYVGSYTDSIVVTLEF